MSTKFYTLLTDIGAAKLANATASGVPLKITKMAVGDGGGKLPTPSAQQTKLVGEKRRAGLNQLYIDPQNASQIIAEQVIPENEGGFWIREVGLFDESGALIAVGNCAESYKPMLNEGSGRTQTVRMILITSRTDNLTLKTDPATILATRKYIEDKVIELTSYIDEKIENQSTTTSLDVSAVSFPDVLSGLNATASGQYFRVPQGPNAASAFIYYINDSGSAKEVAKLAGEKFYRDHFDDTPAYEKKVPLFVDEAGNVPVWLEEGKLNAAGLADTLKESITDKYLDKTLITAEKVPLFVDEAGNVPLWLEKGKLNGVGLASGLSQTKNVTDGETLWLWKAKKSLLKIKGKSKLSLVLHGDSWTEHSTIAMQFTKLYETLGKAGDGWVQMGIDTGITDGMMNGIKMTRSGWSIFDISSNVPNLVTPTVPTFVDGQYIYSPETSATLSLSNLFISSLRIYYYDGDGTFEYSLNSAPSTAVVGGGSGTLKYVELTGIDLTTASSLAITTLKNTGTVYLYGFYTSGSGIGLEINKVGNGGATARSYTPVMDYIANYGGVLSPDLIILLIGTNDHRKDPSSDYFKTALPLMIEAWRKAAPNAGILLVTPAQTNDTGIYSLSVTREIMQEAHKNYGTEFLSFYDFFPKDYATANGLGLWANASHLSDSGANMLFNLVNEKFLKD